MDSKQQGDEPQSGDSSDNTTPALSDTAAQAESTQESIETSLPHNTIDPSVKTPGPPKKGRLGLWFALVFIFLIVIGAGVVGYYGYILFNDKTTAYAEELNRFKQALATNESRLVQLQSEAKRDQQARANDLAQVSQRVTETEQRIQAQNKRLMSLATTTREDWLLAEAEYLLKLANQRVLIERSAESAIGLLEEADKILRDLASPDLFELRKELQRDLVALKLVKNVDLEGVYLKLSALADSLPALPLLRPKEMAFQQLTEVKVEEQSVEPSSLWQRFLTSLGAFSGRLDNYVRVIDHTEVALAILPPEQSAYIRLNLRFILERTQIALLRGQSAIYVKSVNDAEQWLLQYFPVSREREQFIKVLNELAAIKVEQSIPDISSSLKSLHNYIDTLHQLNRGSGTPQVMQTPVRQKEAAQ